MKNETARREIESLDYYLQNHTTDYSEESHMAMMMAVKALEQQPCEDWKFYYNHGYTQAKNDVLDKIRAKIIELRSKQNVGVLECLDIIDKYKSEYEGE